MKSLAVLLLFPAIAGAACVNDYPTVQKEYSLSKLVLTGTVVQDHRTAGDIGYFDLDGDTYTPTHVYKGQWLFPTGTVDLFSENSPGRFPMQVGREYLIFAYEDPYGRLIVDNCGNSNLISHSKRALAKVAQLSRERKFIEIL